MNMHRVDTRLFVSLGFGVLATASFMRAFYTPDADYAALVRPQWVTGIGLALAMPPLVTVALGGLSSDKIALGSGIQNFCRMIAASFSASLAITLWDHRGAQHASALIDRLSPYDPAYRAAMDGGPGLSPDMANAVIAQEIGRQASVRGINDVFWFFAFIFLLAIPVVWIARRTPRTDVVAH
jgi:DHA2 family multidrug resistance protein